MISWDDYRNADHTINLVKAYEYMVGFENVTHEAISYFIAIEALCPIVSRQAAAVALITARQIFRGGL